MIVWRNLKTSIKSFTLISKRFVFFSLGARTRTPHKNTLFTLPHTQSHEQEKRVIKKVRELNDEIVINAKRVQQALKLSEDEQLQIKRLNEELQRAWEMVDASKKKEMKAKETIRQLDMEREKMNSLLVKGAGLSLEHESTISALTKTRDELQIRLADSKEENQRQLDSIQILQEQIETHRERIKTNNETIASLRDNLSDSAKAEKRELRRKERMEKELRDVREKLDVKSEAYKHVETQFEEMEHKKKNLDIRLKEVQGKIEKHKRDLKREQRTRQCQMNS